MLDELKEEGIVNKVGGRFKLSTLIQKRMVALNTGARPLVDMKTTDRMAIVLQEILQDKIYLDNSGSMHTRGPSNAVRDHDAAALRSHGGGKRGAGALKSHRQRRLVGHKSVLISTPC